MIATDQPTSESPADVRALRRRASWTIAALALVVVVDLVALASDTAEYQLFSAAGEFTEAEADANDRRQAAVGAIQVALLIATAIVFIRWFVQAYRNLDPRDRRYRVGWAIGGWLVPILNIWRPKQIANDIWHTSDGKGSALLDAWWGAFLISNFVSQVAGRLALQADTVGEFRRASAVYMAADAIDIVAALLAIAVVRAITTRQEEQAARQAATSAA